ncbi:hypothetical protein GCM10009039_15220 [Halocalculus aciditolerans]|uniref:Uncharacterized protein n=2 Tax=Halocalculus aciditolerans TaxID=1383812 RepID=A0A830F616_9EURY|nr:hypothetical protein GCM10009039_15220 [Halocalculus aciditolerans]
MDAVFQVVVGASSIVTAGAAVGGARWAREAAGDARLSRRVLVGETDVESDDGLVGRVRDLEDELNAGGLDDAARVAIEQEAARLRRELVKEDVLND